MRVAPLCNSILRSKPFTHRPLSTTPSPTVGEVDIRLTFALSTKIALKGEYTSPTYHALFIIIIASFIEMD